MTQHADIVSTIAESHRFFQTDAEMPDYLVDAALFGISFGGDIYKCRMPASHFAVGNGRQQELFFFNIDKGCQLVVLLVRMVVCIGFGWDGVCFELSVEYLCYEFARLIDANIVFAHHYAVEIALVTEACQCIDFGCRYGTFVDNGIVHKTIGAVHGDVAVYQFLFLQGGATTQFAAIPMNLLKTGKADYALTGSFASKAYKEAQKFGDMHAAFSSKETNFDHVPTQDELDIRPDADYFYICANNTIYGTEYQYDPETPAGVELVADMSSNILSKPVDVSKYGVIYAGAQKNMGPAGVTVVIVREDLLGNYPLEKYPVMLDWKTMADKDSMYNTPPTYGIYVLGLVAKWVEDMGGVKAMQERAEKRSSMLYDYLDSQDFYKTVAAKDSRSHMNVTFRTGNDELDAKFAKESMAAGMSNLKGHRSVGGMRASIYNAMPIEGVEKLIDFMKKFAEENK